MLWGRYDREGGAQQAAQPLSDARASGGRMAERRCTLAQITDEGMGTNGQPAFVQVCCQTLNMTILACQGSHQTLCGKQALKAS